MTAFERKAVPSAAWQSFCHDSAKSHTTWLKSSCKQLAFLIGQLSSRYPFRTNLEVELDNAEKSILESLEAVREARRQYQALNVVEAAE